MKDNYIMKYKNALIPNEQQIKEFTEGDIDTPTTPQITLVPTRDHYCLIAWGNPTVHPNGDSNSWAMRIWQTQ